MSEQDMSFIYYINRSGAVAVSFDDGLNILLPTGRYIEPTEMWEEVTEDLEHKLNEGQKKALEHRRANPPSKMDLLVREYTRRRLLEERHYEQPNPKYRKLPEDVLVVRADFD